MYLKKKKIVFLTFNNVKNFYMQFYMQFNVQSLFNMHYNMQSKHAILTCNFNMQIVGRSAPNLLFIIYKSF